MKYRSEIIIANSLAEVASLFEDQSNNRLWQPDFVSMQQHKFDADKSINLYEINGRMIEVHIQILENNLPQNFDVNCEMTGLTQKVKHMFVEHAENKTKWVIDTEFTTESFIIKIIMLLLPNMLRKRTMIYMLGFKKFAESIEINIEDAKKVYI